MSTENKKEVVVQQRNITDAVLDKVKVFQSSAELRLPSDYSAENVVKAASLVLQETKTREGKLILEVCTRGSIAGSVLKMVVWRLSPLKNNAIL